MKRYVYINNTLVPEEKATVSVFDRGLNYGHGVFETIKAVDGKAVYLKEHLDRLKRGALAIGIKSHGLKDLYNSVKGNMLERLLKANKLESGHAYIRITITAGKDYGTHLPSKDLKPAIIAIAKPIDVKVISLLGRSGVEAITIRGACHALGQIKSLNYLPNVLAKMEAGSKGAYEGIFVTPDGLVLEGTATNVFIVSKGVLKTPPAYVPPLFSRGGRGGLYPGILPGIMRQFVIKTARENGIKVVERGITIKEFLTADETFLTNSIIEVVPLIKVGSKTIGRRRPGPVTRRIQRFLKQRDILAGDARPARL